MGQTLVIAVLVGLLAVAPGLVVAAESPGAVGSLDGANGAVVGGGTSTVEQATTARPRIVGLYPNPPTEDDRGEFVTVALPPDANLSAYSLADEQTRVSLSPRLTDANTTPTTLDSPEPSSDTVTFSTDPGLTAWLTNRTVAPLSSALRLANSGETVRLVHRGRVVDEVSYESAPESERYEARADSWEPLGATDRAVVTAEDGTVGAFVLPDEPDRAVATLADAERRVLLAGYTFTSSRVVDTLAAAIDRGVRVEVLVDGSPVGGMSSDGAAALSRLDRAGATVRVFDGDRARYRYHHPKYAVVDDTALVTTENWKPSGVGGASNRGWAVTTGQEAVVEGLVETYRADAGWVDTVRWGEYDPTVVESDPATGSYPERFEATRLPVDRTHLLVAPDNAARVVRERVRRAEESLAIKQVRIGDRRFGLLQDVLDAAARGVEVRILLSGAWYVAEENEQFAAWLRDQAAAADLPLSVRVADPGGAFERIHAKGLLIDGEQALVGSLNWNDNAFRNNREVALLLEGEAVAGYFGSVFDADWEGESGSTGERDLPLGIALAVLAGVVVSILAAKHIAFEERSR